MGTAVDSACLFAEPIVTVPGPGEALPTPLRISPRQGCQAEEGGSLPWSRQEVDDERDACRSRSISSCNTSCDSAQTTTRCQESSRDSSSLSSSGRERCRCASCAGHSFWWRDQASNTAAEVKAGAAGHHRLDGRMTSANGRDSFNNTRRLMIQGRPVILQPRAQQHSWQPP